MFLDQVVIFDEECMQDHPRKIALIPRCLVGARISAQSSDMGGWSARPESAQLAAKNFDQPLSRLVG